MRAVGVPIDEATLLDSDKARACEGKESYQSPALAHRVVKRRRSRGLVLEVYRCEHCGGYHQGRNGQRKPKKTPRRPSRLSTE